LRLLKSFALCDNSFIYSFSSNSRVDDLLSSPELFEKYEKIVKANRSKEFVI